jgi:hypothetical protein
MEANSQALRELQKQEFIIGSYIPEEYLVRFLILFSINNSFIYSETYSRECCME